MFDRAAKVRANLWLDNATLVHLAKLASVLRLDRAEVVDRAVAAFAPQASTKRRALNIRSQPTFQRRRQMFALGDP